MPERAPTFTELEFGITAIDAEYVRPLCAASHLIVEHDRAAFVDTGTNHSVPLLLAVLERKGIPREAVDYVFLTHIHLDHAGGAGRLMSELPNARVVVHPRGMRHLADPAKLIAGTMAVYGERAYRELYGDLVPIAAERIHTTSDGETVELAGRSFEFFYTEGHARHHQCIADPNFGGIFSGDSFGLSYREFDTATGEFIFPTTTPVHFDPPAAHAAIDEIMRRSPQRVYLTHYSEVTDLERLASELHQCLDEFVDLTERHAPGAEPQATLAAALFDCVSRRLDMHGVDHDAERRHAILDMDCDINAQGLLHWYQHHRNEGTIDE